MVGIIGSVIAGYFASIDRARLCPETMNHWMRSCRFRRLRVDALPPEKLDMLEGSV